MTNIFDQKNLLGGISSLEHVPALFWSEGGNTVIVDQDVVLTIGGLVAFLATGTTSDRGCSGTN